MTSPGAPVFRVPVPALGLRRAQLRALVVGLLAMASFFPVAYFALAYRQHAVAVGFFPFWLAAMLGLGVIAFLPSKVVVGHDGLLLSWLGSMRFIAYADIRLIRGTQTPSSAAAWDLQDTYDGIEIHLVSGELLRFPSRESNQLYRGIAEAVDAWWRRDGSVKASLVERGARDPQGWLRALQNIGARTTADYRNPAIAGELWRIVEDLAAPPDARAGAAVALQRSLGDEGRARLEKAARVTAQPKLRVAIETAAHTADEEALIAALAEIEASAPERKPHSSNT